MYDNWISIIKSKIGQIMEKFFYKAKYIQGNLDGKIDLRKKTKEQINNLLETMKLTQLILKKNYFN